LSANGTRALVSVEAALVCALSISALLGYAAMVVGAALLVGIVAIGLTLLITVAYWRGRDDDPGVTSEVALIIVLILGALCTRSPELAVAIGVVVAGLLTYREKAA
jgi:uncharacterized membrane protein (DUF4010 family)